MAKRQTSPLKKVTLIESLPRAESPREQKGPGSYRGVSLHGPVKNSTGPQPTQLKRLAPSPWRQVRFISSRSYADGSTLQSPLQQR